MTTHTTTRVPCPICEGKKMLPDPEMSSGQRVCSACMGGGFVDIAPEPPPTCDVPESAA